MKLNRICFNGTFWVLLSMLALMAMTSCKKSAADLIVGNWKVTEASTFITDTPVVTNTPVVGDIWEFRSNGTLRMQNKGVVHEGSYRVEGSYLYTEGGWGSLGGTIIDMDKNYMKVAFSQYTLGFSRTTASIAVNGGGGNDNGDDNGGDNGGNNDPVVEHPEPTIDVLHGDDFITGTVENPQIISFDDPTDWKFGFHVESNPSTSVALAKLEVTYDYIIDGDIYTFDTVINLTGQTQYLFIEKVFNDAKDGVIVLQNTVTARVTDADGEENTASIAYQIIQEEVEHPEPSIAVLTGNHYLYDGEEIYFQKIYHFGFVANSNIETGKELSRLVVTINDSPCYEAFISGTTFVYEDDVMFVEKITELVEVEFKAVVTDVAGETATATFTVNIVERPLEVKPFEWIRVGGANGVGLEEFGLKWNCNGQKFIYAYIEPLEGAILYQFQPEYWNMVNTDSEKMALFDEMSGGINLFKGVSAVTSSDYDFVIGTIYQGRYYLIHITHAEVNVGRITTITITGEWK